MIESYRKVAMQVDNEEFGRHQAAVDELAKSGLEDALALVRLYLRKYVSVDAVAKLRRTIQKHDHTFAPRGNEELLRILAGEALAQMVETRSDQASTTAALALRCNRDKPDEVTVVDHIRPHLVSFLDGAAESLRNSLAKKHRKVSELDSSSLSALKKVTDAAGLAKQMPAFVGLISSLESRLKDLSEQGASILREHQVLAEENDVLWHIVVGSCALGNGASVGTSYPRGVAPIVALEMSEFVRLIPVPSTYRDLLLKELRVFGADLNMETTFKDAYDELPETAKAPFDERLQSDPNVDLCPLLGQVGLAADQPLNPQPLADLTFAVFLELLLLKSAGPTHG